jgi:hypothetical protein
VICSKCRRDCICAPIDEVRSTSRFDRAIWASFATGPGSLGERAETTPGAWRQWEDGKTKALAYLFAL